MLADLQGQHGVGGGDAQRGEDVTPVGLGSHQVVEAESKGSIACRDLEAGGALTWARSLLMGAVDVTPAVMPGMPLTSRKDQ